MSIQFFSSSVSTRTMRLSGTCMLALSRSRSDLNVTTLDHFPSLLVNAEDNGNQCDDQLNEVSCGCLCHKKLFEKGVEVLLAVVSN